MFWPGGWRRMGATWAVVIGALVMLASVARATTSPTASPPSVTPPAHSLIVDSPGVLTSGDGHIFAAGIGWYASYSGSALIADTSDTRVITAPPTTNGQVSAAAPVGAGWYVGGDFSEVGGAARRFLARIEHSGTLDPTFMPRVDGFVDSIVPDGDRVYIAGYFSHVDGRSRAGLAELDARTGRLIRDFDPSPGVGAGSLLEPVPELALGRDGLYAAAAGKVVGLNPSSGAMLFDDPVAQFSADPTAPFPDVSVGALAALGDTVYVGTDGVYALNAVSGVPVGTFADHQIGRVQYLLADAGRLIAGGDLHGDAGAVALDATDGRLIPGFTCRFGGSVTAAVAGADTLWLGGYRLSSAFYGSASSDLNTIPGKVLAVNPWTCAARAAAPLLPSGPVNALAVNHGRLLIGGLLTSPSVTRTDLAEFSPSTGRLTAHFGNGTLASDGSELSAAVYAGGRLWESTSFALLAVSPRTGATKLRVPTTYGPAVTLAAADGHLFAFAPDQAPHVFEYDLSTGRRVPFRIPLHGYTNTMTAGDGGLYLGGSYKRRRPSGQPANLAVLRIDPVSGALEPQFDPHANGPVSQMQLIGRRLYIAGDFTEIHRVRRRTLGAVDAYTGDLNVRFHPVGIDPSVIRSGSFGMTVRQGLVLLYPYSYGGVTCPGYFGDALNATNGQAVRPPTREPPSLTLNDGRPFGTSCVNEFATISYGGAVYSLGPTG